MRKKERGGTQPPPGAGEVFERFKGLCREEKRKALLPDRGYCRDDPVFHSFVHVYRDFHREADVFQSATARIAAIPVNLITGRPYGLFRDRLFLALGIERKNPWKMILGDTLAFVIFQVPLYVIVLLCAGATWKQIAVSSVFMSAIFSLAGRPYGIFLDFCRRVAGNVVRNL